jgi:hypothetical protein
MSDGSEHPDGSETAPHTMKQTSTLAQHHPDHPTLGDLDLTERGEWSSERCERTSALTSPGVQRKARARTRTPKNRT